MEQVVIVDPAEADAGTWSAVMRARKTQEFSERVFVVEAEKSVIDALRALPGMGGRTVDRAYEGLAAVGLAY